MQIGPGARIGGGARILGQVTIGAGARIGTDALIYPGARIGDRVEIGHRVIIHPNASIGADGFSFAIPEPASVVLCGWQMGRAMMVALDKMDSDPAFFTAKLITARFYAESVLTQAPGLAQSVRLAGSTTNRMSADMF